MGYNTAISGLDAAQTDLNTIGNNIANVNTVGFKESNAQFGDLYAASLAGSAGASTTPGIGVSTVDLSQNFTQGNIQTTGNPLDMAINGPGFFIVNNNGTMDYTRNGQFHVSSNGVLENNGDLPVQGFQPVPGSNGRFSTILSNLTISESAMPPQATSQAALVANLNANDVPPSVTPFSASNPNSYNDSTTFQVYDSLGNAQDITLYFVQASGTGSANQPNQWDVYYSAGNSSGTTVATGSLTTLQFSNTGQLVSGGTASFTVSGWGDGSASSTISVNLSGSTLTNSPFAVTSENVNGYAPGTYSSISVQSTGEIDANYTNGQKKAIGKVALANFANLQGLAPISGNLWSATATAGNPLVNSPGTAGLGVIQSGAVESSNVSLSSQLVDMIVAQQAYQANTSTIKTEQQDTQSLLQL
ncbi:flagellar hook protein FlgE [Acidithiobacillus caldus]|uniref:Flagellar hook protein FlgE n=2 Tax=Acidithiobacillus caldus TaxID=33059 RepID=A0A059ZSI0_ACICK|nr:flagellar hook protein FlgE [Acidithiobacillus caldus]AIA55779.1 Flagellar hook protein FlgE [Acidithiobacillus caldus ATCC 51756]MBU2729959.1 flagellar hook protein FlgE [Acidithiobacillus caldus]MBU2734193.1 flagellar hook protein FlgE [Acidithiobacillus caldus ATCC 51756]MBU2745140.1 flagellar hook protein FlgE [Acidithiobacillus caldus]MBU2779928.1 flagellar hook protein FlgE [Acidithiobacillus caldus]